MCILRENGADGAKQQPPIDRLRERETEFNDFAIYKMDLMLEEIVKMYPLVTCDSRRQTRLVCAFGDGLPNFGFYHKL